ncbi:CvpA family protein [Deinococcus peraridilitoris]|nr:CvpA family protein [Deinococcus peraridilitoris]
MEWNFVDVGLIGLILLSTLQGWRHGFVLGLIDVLRLVGAFVLALRFYPTLAAWLGQVADWEETWTVPAAFLLIFVLGGALINLIGYMLIHKIPRGVHEARTNRLLGLIPALLQGGLFTVIVSALLMTLPLPATLRQQVRESHLANELATYAERAQATLNPVFGRAVEQTMNSRTIRPDSGERVTLPFRVTGAQPAPELEAQMLTLLNRERAAHGLAPLQSDPGLTEVARRHSADMFERGYFAHVTPEGKTPFDRLSEAGVFYLSAGENLALAPTLPLAHTGLMNSPGHRANILRPQFGRVGIGILDGGSRGLMVTQKFRN